MNIPRFTPGALRLRWKQHFGHGLRAAWYRDVVRPRILHTAAVTGTTDPTAEIHVLTSAGDWLNLLWTLKSFYAVAPRKYALCIHGDKTLPAVALENLAQHFPDARIIPRDEADARADTVLRDFPRCRQFRNTNLLAPKVFDFPAFLGTDRMALFDSDLLFFAEPEEYLRRIEDPEFRQNAFNADIASSYTVEPAAVIERCGFALHPKINSGLGLIHRASMRLDWIEEFLSLPGITEGHFWRIEQTLYALCSSRYGVELLPAPYTFYHEPGLHGRPFRHYIGCIRHLMYEEGMRQLTRNGFLRQR